MDDPRMREYWVLMGGPCKILAIIAAYVALTTRILPEFMKNRYVFILNFKSSIHHATFYTIKILHHLGSR